MAPPGITKPKGRIVPVSYTSDESMFEEVDRRIKELRRSTYTWVKRAPQNKQQMCAVVDNRNGITTVQRMSEPTQQQLNTWLHRTSDRKWQSIIDFNDAPNGAKSVDDVIVVLEKFRAEL